MPHSSERSRWLRTALFSLVVPGTVLVLAPVALVAGGVGPRLALGSARLLGIAPVAIGLWVIARCFADFVRLGRGTPAPYDPPRELVVAGLYCRVRNPQYLGVLLVVAGEAMLTGAVVLVGYAVVLAIMYHLFIRFYEEPALRRAFGDAYSRYCQTVPRWVPGVRKPMA
jgi:protein-S-isoprenylcysteine O-methyltransferase Ste14